MNKRPCVLVVDDESEIRTLVDSALSELNYEIIESSNGLDALDVIRRTEFNVIISDIMMPGMNGLQLLEAVRKEGFKQPFIVITGFASKKFGKRALKLGAFDFLEKPFDLNVIRSVTESAIRVGMALDSLMTPLEDADPKKNGRNVNVTEW